MELRLPYWVFGCGRKNKALRERQEEHAIGFRCCGVLTVFQEFYSMVDMFTQLGSSLGTLRVGQYKEHRSVRDVLVYQEKEPHCWPVLAQLYHLQDPVGTIKWFGTSGWKQSVDINTWITAAQGWSVQERKKHSFAIEALRNMHILQVCQYIIAIKTSWVCTVGLEKIILHPCANDNPQRRGQTWDLRAWEWISMNVL